jgi:hypothetical protein
MWISTGLRNVLEAIIQLEPKKSLGYIELKQHSSWFGEEFSELLIQRKEAKPQWLHDHSQVNGDNLNNVRREAGRYVSKTRGNV